MNFEKSQNEVALNTNEILISPEEAVIKADEIQVEINFLESVRAKKTEELSDEEKDGLKKYLGEEWEKKFPNIGWQIGYLESEKYQYDTAGSDGAKKVDTYYPTGAYYKGSEFGNEMKEKEEKLKELYHNLGLGIDRSMQGMILDYNRDQNEDDKIYVPSDSPHILNWHSVNVLDDSREQVVEMPFDKGKINFVLYKNSANKWHVSLKMLDAYLLPKKYLEKQKALLRLIKDDLEHKVNQVLG